MKRCTDSTGFPAPEVLPRSEGAGEEAVTAGAARFRLRAGGGWPVFGVFTSEAGEPG